MIIKNQFVAIEGLDGSGKSTQIELLLTYLHNKGVETRFIHFPRHNDGVFGTLISKFLRGEFGNVSQVHPQLVALLFAEDRKDFAKTIREWLSNGYFVLVDRYVLSNIAFQCAKTKDIKEKKELAEWINVFEYEYNTIPKPNLSLFLDVPFSFTQKSLEARMAVLERDYLNGQDDIHEKDFALQKAVKQEYENMLETDKSITGIKCYNANNEMKSIAEIHAQIVALIEKVM